ncbi:MAG: nitrogenase component 1 [Ruminococcus sp.]|nr:nitrogenase component 1 [Ruminococcus sp.]
MHKEYERPPGVKISQADINELHPTGLEYNAPARGMWNIVHQGMLIPEAHQIFVCAQGCLRGVILTAAEMLELDRLSWVSVSEEDMFDGSLETDIVDGVTDILNRLGKRPPVVLLFLSCVHLFAGVDYENILRELSGSFPDITFIDCYMTPTMRTTVTPIVKMSAQMYRPLNVTKKDPKAINIIGCDRPTDPDSELVRIIKGSGHTLRDISECNTYGEFQRMAEASLNIGYIPTCGLALEELEEKHGTPSLYLPMSFDYDTISENYSRLCGELGIDTPDFSEDIAAAEKALDDARSEVGDIAVAVDFTAVTRPLELMKLLSEHGFNVKYAVVDSVGEEAAAFEWLRDNRPDIELYSSTNVNMLYQHIRATEPVLAIGQKAAYYFATDHFVNIIMNGGLYGFSGITKLCGMIAEAYREPTDKRRLISHKGFGCASCLTN